jgi:Tfp pilus assembly protein FimT
MEVVMAAVIVAILAATSYFSMRNFFPNLRLNAAMRQAKSDLSLGRLTAIKENAFVSILFDTGAGNYTVFVDDGNDGGGGVIVANRGNGKLEVNERTLKTGTMPSGVELYDASMDAADEARVRFDSRGLSMGRNGHAYFRNANGTYRGVQVSVTGRVTAVRSNNSGTTWTKID